MTSPTSSTTAGNSMIVLAVETSGPEGSLAVAKMSRGDAVGTRLTDPCQVTWDKKAVHSELITAKLQELLVYANLELKDVTHVTVNAGPGSFTGIRVGLSLARTLAYALNKPILTLDSLTLLAAKFGKSGDHVFVGTKAVQKFYYSRGFVRTGDTLQTILPPCSLDQSQVMQISMGEPFNDITYSRTLIEGISDKFSTELEAQDHLTWLALSPDAQEFSSWKDVKPLYIRASEAEEKLRTGLLKSL